MPACLLFDSCMLIMQCFTWFLFFVNYMYLMQAKKKRMGWGVKISKQTPKPKAADFQQKTNRNIIPTDQWNWYVLIATFPQKFDTRNIQNKENISLGGRLIGATWLHCQLFSHFCNLTSYLGDLFLRGKKKQAVLVFLNPFLCGYFYFFFALTAKL